MQGPIALIWKSTGIVDQISTPNVHHRRIQQWKNLLNHTRGEFAYFIIAMQRIVAERFILFVGTKILRLVDAGTH